jgi:hypothetical protein
MLYHARMVLKNRAALRPRASWYVTRLPEGRQAHAAQPTGTHVLLRCRVRNGLRSMLRPKGKVNLPVALSFPLSGRDGVQLVSVSLQAIVPDAVTGRAPRPPRAHTKPRQQERAPWGEARA